MTVVRLSRQQMGIWLLEEASGASGVFNSGFTQRLHGPLDVDALRRALGVLAARHEVLRTVVRLDESGPVGVVLPATDVPVTVTTAADPDSGPGAFLAPFDVHRGPLLRAHVVREAPDRHLLTVSCHHLACDGQSLKILRTELAEAYNDDLDGGPAEPDRGAPPYAEYADYQHDQVEGDDFARSLAYWRERLDGAPEQFSLPADHPRPALRSYRAARHITPVPLPLARAAAAFARARGLTPFIVLHAAFCVLLARLADSEDTVVGTAMANRQDGDEAAVGPYMNLVPLRVRLGPGTTFEEALGLSRDAVLGAFDHQEMPFEVLLNAMGRSYDASRQQLFQATVQLLERTGDALRMTGLRAEPVSEEGEARSQFDLGLNVTANGEELDLDLTYNVDLYDAATAESLGQRLIQLLAAGLADPSLPVRRLPVLLGADRRALERWNATERPLPAARTVLDLVRAAAARAPQATAFERADGTISYGALMERADRITAALAAHGVPRGAVVGVSLPRGHEDLPAAQLGAWQHGCAYIVVNPDDPDDRIDFQLRDAAVAALLTCRDSMTDPEWEWDSLFLDGPLDAPPAAPPAAPPDRTDLAYIVYTSGSTGRPKGVAIEHAGVLNLVAWHHRTFGTTAGDRMTLSAAPWFDGWVLELFPALAAGATLCSPPGLAPVAAELRDWLLEHRVTLPHFTTAVAETVFDLPWPRDTTVRTMLTGGDRLSPYPWGRLPFGVYNGYGPTEGTVIATSGRVREGRRPAGRPLVGGPLDNFRVRVLDSHRDDLPVGVPGEIWISGIGLARSYFNRPDLTGERFVDLDGVRHYRTGDIGRWLREGTLEVLGRSDDQVKIRGFRIELGEIESVLVSHPDVAQAGVLLREDRPGKRQLVAYVVPVDTGKGADPAELRARLADHLPVYMLPAAYVVMDALPLTVNGKLDRRALPAPERTPGRGPRTPRERALCDLFAELLDVPRVGADEGFFDLGGHSLLAARLVGRIRSAMDVEVSVADLFQAPSAAALAERLDAGTGGAGAALGVLLPLRTAGDEPPLFCLHPGGGLSWCYAGLLGSIPAGYPVHGLQARGIADPAQPLPASIEAMTADYLEQIRAVRPDGPYRLLGWSFGGVLAHAVAVALQGLGERVDLLVQIDAPARTDPEEAVDALAALRVVLDSAALADPGLAEGPIDPAVISRRLRAQSPAFAALDEQTVTALVAVAGNNHLLMKKFTPGRFTGDVVFFDADRTPAGRPKAVGERLSAGWSPHVTGRIDRHGVDCAHHEIMRPEAAAAIGRLLADRLARLSGGGPGDQERP